MAANLHHIDRDTPMLLPEDLRSWIPEDDMVHFVVETIEGLSLSKGLGVNERGTGSKQYPPRMMLMLLVYCYSQGVFSSRKIERATHRDIAVRYLAGNLHPDHDTIARFRRSNPDLLQECFEKVLLLAKDCGILKIGRVSVDGTHIYADASIDKNLTADRAAEIEAQVNKDVEALLAEAEACDAEEGGPDGDTLPEALASREKIRERVRLVREEADRRAVERHEKAVWDHAEKVRKREASADKRGGRIKPPPAAPEVKGGEQINLTDPGSRVMRKSKRSSCTQSYNAQAVVSNESMLIVGNHVSQCSNDSGELLPAVASIPKALGQPGELLADSSYGSATAVEGLKAAGIEGYISIGGESQHRDRSYDYRPREPKPPPDPKAPWRVEMKAKLETEKGRQIYRERFHTVEPVFGIIKEAIGFRQFSMRGLAKVEAEWELVATAYNLKRMFNLLRA